MKSKDLQEIIFSKYETGRIPKKIYEDLNGAIITEQSNDGVR